jgi:hypothetical protein
LIWFSTKITSSSNWLPILLVKNSLTAVAKVLPVRKALALELHFEEMIF